MTADRPHGKDMITLKSHKTVIPGRAEGERQGHVPEWGATEATQPNRQKRKANLRALVFLSLLSKTDSGVSDKAQHLKTWQR